MELDGPPRMVGWITWSGRERSSQTQFLPVPGVWLIHSTPYLLSSIVLSLCPIFLQKCTPPALQKDTGGDIKTTSIVKEQKTNYLFLMLKRHFVSQ